MVHDVNQIALFFAAYPREEAVAGVEAHLRSFWTPHMRAQLIDHVNAGGQGLNEIAAAAAARLSPPACS